MSLGEVDTLNLTFDKLQTLFDESQGYYESFLDANNLYKTGKLSDKEFFQKLGDYVVAYSALEFLSVKVIMEMKKTKLELALDKCNHTMELVRTIVPILVLIIQIIILFKIS